MIFALATTKATGSFANERREISRCWLKFESLENFLSDMGPRPDGHSLDRIDVNGHYEPSNCRWATREQQARNRRDTRLLTFDGRTMCSKDWAEFLGMPVHTITNRLNQGLPLDEVLDPSRRRIPKGIAKIRRTTRPGVTKVLKGEYHAWKAMVQRCTNPQHQAWANYGGRGITVCEAWLDFETFYRDMGPLPPGTSLDRIDNAKGYEPKNCRWATRKEQARNHRGNRVLTYRGRSMPLVEWSEQFDIPAETIRNRLRTGWTVGQALGFQPRAGRSAERRFTTTARDLYSEALFQLAMSLE